MFKRTCYNNFAQIRSILFRKILEMTENQVHFYGI